MFAPPSATSPFRVGAAFRRALRIFAAGFGKFFLLGLLPLLALAAVAAAAAFVPEGQRAWLEAPWALLQLTLGGLASGACVIGADEIAEGGRFSLSGALRAAAGDIAAITAVTVIGGALIALAASFFIVPAFIVMAVTYVALPARILERRGPIAALERSGSLTNGRKWRVFGLILATWAFGAMILSAPALFAIVGVLEHSDWEALVGLGLTMAGASTLQAFTAVASAVAHGDLAAARPVPPAP